MAYTAHSLRYALFTAGKEAYTRVFLALGFQPIDGASGQSKLEFYDVVFKGLIAAGRIDALAKAMKAEGIEVDNPLKNTSGKGDGHE